ELGHLLMRAAGPDAQVTSVRSRQEVGQFALDDAQTVRGKLQIANDLRIQKRDCVSRDRIAKTGVKFFGHRRAADHMPALEHSDFETGCGKISRAYQAVVAGADDQNVTDMGSG